VLEVLVGRARRDVDGAPPPQPKPHRGAASSDSQIWNSPCPS
jgi:hypothetical protein